MLLAILGSGSFSVHAQCGSGYGPSLFMETFGNGTTLGPALTVDNGTGTDYTTGATAYIFDSPAGNVQDNHYTIATSPMIAKGNWVDIHDHTGDVNGKMLVVNASYAPNIFYKRKVSNLCYNTNFKFSAFLVEVNGPGSFSICGGAPLPANVRFEVQDTLGNILSSLSTGDIAAQNIPNPQWRGYTFSFNTGNYSTVNVVLRNINPGGCGNDLAIDDISVQACGPYIAPFGPTGPVCLNNSISFQAIQKRPGYTTPFFQWQQSIDGGKNWADISGANDSIYSIVKVQQYQNNFQFRCRVAGSVNNIKNDNCTMASVPLTLVIQTQPLTFTPPKAICRNGGLVNLVPYGNPAGGQFSGTGVTGNTFDPSALVHTSDTLYYTYQGSITKCTTTDTANVLILSSPVTKITANGPEAMCAGMKVQLSIAGTAAIQWYLNGAAIQGATAAVYYAGQTGKYKVVQTNSLGCSSSDSTQVTIYPVPTLFMDGGTATLCQGSSATITGPVSANSYKWTYGHKITLPATGNTLVTQTGGLFTLTIVDKNSCTDSADYHIAINDVPVPVVQESLDSIICQGDSTTFGVFNSFVTYQWYRSATGTAGSYTPITGAIKTSFAAHFSGFYYISVTNVSGCAGSSAPHQVIVMNPPGKAHVTASTSAPVCYPGGVTVSTGAIPGLSYQWKWNGIAQPNSNSSSYIARYTGFYSVIERNSTGCFTLSDSVQVIINAKPQAYAPTGNLQSCGGAPTVLSAFIQSGYSYAWYLNNNPLMGQSASTLSAAVSGSYFYVVTNANGCSDTSPAVSVNIFPKVTPQIRLDGPSVLCASDSTTMEVTATFPSYQWFENGNPMPAGTNRTLRVSTLGTNQYTVQIKDLNGCSGISAAMQIKVNQLPVPVLQPKTAMEFCSGGNVLLTVQNPSNYTNIIWKNNGTQIQGVTGATYTATLSGSYSVTATNTNGCTGSSLALPVIVDPKPAPILNVTGPVVLCAGKASSFTLNVLNSVSGGMYTWYQTDSLNPAGASQIVSSGIDNSTYTLKSKASAGYYSVKVTSPAGCSGFSDTAFISLYKPPLINLGKQIICSGDFTTLTSPPGYNFQWTYSPDGVVYTPAPGINNLNTYTATSAGFYMVSLQDKPSGGCSGSSVIQVKTNIPLVVNITGTPSSCPGVPVVLTSLISNTPAPSNPAYQWSFKPAGSAAYHTIAGGVFSSIGIDSSGTYKVLISAQNFCPASATYAYSNFTVLKPLITPNASICSGNSITLLNTGPALPAGDTYQWYRNFQALPAPAGTSSSLTVIDDGYYFMQVKDPNGCFSNSDTSYITVVPLPQPSIYLSGPTVVCAGSPVHLSVSSRTNFSYHWTYSATGSGAYTNLSPDITDPVLNITANSGFYKVTETSTSGCSGSSSIFVVIDAIPLVQLPANASICPGSVLKLGPLTNANLTWFYTPVSTSTPVIISVADSVLANLAGIYSVQARNPSDSRCFSTASTVVSVNPVPVALFNARDSCRKSSTMTFINSTSLAGGPAPTYKWNFGDPSSGSLNTSVAVNGTHQYTATGRYPVTLIATTVNGCADTVLATYNFKGTKPDAKFTISGNLSRLCGGQSIGLRDASSTAYGTIVSYRWDIFTASGSVAPVSAAPVMDPFIQFPDTTAQMSYRIRESVTSSSGCIDTASQVISIGAAPAVSLHLVQKIVCSSPGLDTLAGGMPMTGGTGYYSGAGITNGIFNARKAGPGKHPVLFTFTDALSGCSATAIDTVQVMPRPGPTIISVAGIITPCTKTVKLTAVNSSAINYSWMFNDTLIANASTSVYTATRSGTYTAMAFTAAGCERDTSILLSIANGPRAAFVVGAVCQNLIVNFVNLSTTGDRSALTYKWNFGDPGSPSNTSTVLNPQHQYMSAGKPLVTLMVFSASGCVDTLAMPVVVSAVDSNANFRISSNTPYCIHEPLVFQDSSLLPGQLINKYVWNFYDETGKLIRRDSGSTVLETFGANLTAPAVYTVQETLSTGLNCPVLTPVKSFTINPLTAVTYIPEAARDMCAYAPGFSLTGGSTVPAGAAGKGYYTGSGVIDSTTFMPSKAQPGLNAVSYVFNNQYGCSSSAVVQYNVHDTIPLAGQRIETMEGTVITLMGTGALPFTFGPNGITSISADSLKWNWSPGTGLTGTSVPNPYFTASDSINYTLTLTSPFGCISRAVFRIIVHKLIHVPNAFTPNGDGTNDYWVIRGLDLYPNADVFIFNRYGQQLFHSKGYGKPWNGQYNGRSLPMGTYYYLIQLNGQNGISGKTQQTITGPLTLLY